MSDTPLTDEIAHRGYQAMDLVARLCDLSSQLEREANALRNHIATLENGTRWQCQCGGTDCEGMRDNEKLRAEVERRLAEIDVLKSALGDPEQLANESGTAHARIKYWKVRAEFAESALAEARKDTERLDWLAIQYQRERRAYSDASVNTGGDTWPDEVTLLVHTDAGKIIPIDGPTLRAAIDAAKEGIK